MKKLLKHYSIIIMAVVFFLSLCGCTKLEDVIPTKFGAPEGLWLYLDNTRSRTDGSEAESLLKTVTVDGIEYVGSEFGIQGITYATQTHKIFFVIVLNGVRHIYLYDYSAKTGESLYALNVAHNMISVYASNKYLYYKTQNLYLLFTQDGELVCDSFDGTLDGDILYTYGENEKSFKWFKDNIIHEVKTDTAWFFDSRYYKHYGDFVYFFDQSRIIAVNLNTDEYSILYELQSETPRFYHDMYFINSELYLVSSIYKDNGKGNTAELFNLHKISGNSVELVYDFGNVRSGGVKATLIDNDIYFKAVYGGKPKDTHYFAYSIKNKKMRKVFRIPSVKTEPVKKIVGEYTFYIGYKKYSVSDSFMGFKFEYCSYLYRTKKGKTEIMQYSLYSAKFFDDICQF